jgi:hypothetical protein
MNRGRALVLTIGCPSRFLRAAEGAFLFASASDRVQAHSDGQHQPHPGFSQGRELTVQAFLIATHTAGLGTRPVFGRYSTL